jgi:hypothetical protein
MNTASATNPGANPADINRAAKRVLSTDSTFFRACSLETSASECAELRFLRGVLFYYSLLCECGAKPIRFCVNQSQFAPLVAFDPAAALKIIHALRTQAAHSLEQSADDDRLRFTARSWFRQHTALDFPAADAHWSRCADQIEQTGAALLQGIVRFLKILQDDPEMASMRAELRREIEGGIRPIDAETVVAEVLAEQGRRDLSPGKLCERWFADWSRTLSVKSANTNLLLDLRKLVETTVCLTPEPPPISAKEIMDALNIGPGPMVGALVKERDRLCKEGIKNRDDLLAKLNLYSQGMKPSAPNQPAS